MIEHFDEDQDDNQEEGDPQGDNQNSPPSRHAPHPPIVSTPRSGEL